MGVGTDITEQNSYVSTAGAVTKNLTVKFFHWKKIKAHKKRKKIWYQKQKNLPSRYGDIAPNIMKGYDKKIFSIHDFRITG